MEPQLAPRYSPAVTDPPRFMITFDLPPTSQAQADALLDALAAAAPRQTGASVRISEHDACMEIVIDAAHEGAARSEAVRILRACLESAGMISERIAPTAVELVERPPGMARRVEQLPEELEIRSVALDDGRTVRATFAGGLGDWTVQVGDEQPWSGRAIREVLDEALELDEDDARMQQATRHLAGRLRDGRWRFACPCCERYTLDEPPPGTYDICDACGWEDDGIQFDDPEYRGGANEESLADARARWAPR